MVEGAEALLLRQAGWAGAVRAPLAGDASARRYHRLTRADGATAVLMQAPVATAADRDSLAAFLRVGAHLADLGLSPPDLLAAAPEVGLLLLEDLGDATLARLLEGDPDTAHNAYAAAAAVADRLAAAPLPGWAARPDADGLAAMLAPTLAALPADPALADLPARMAAALSRHAGGPPVLSLRDFHGDNLIWLPGRSGDARLGLLDFQDAVALPLGYDLASLLDDPRRDIPADWRADLVARFAAVHGRAPEEASARIATLSLLRNLRILGIFRRLATVGGKRRYAGFLPRTGRLVEAAAAHPALSELRAPVARLLALGAHWAEVSEA